MAKHKEGKIESYLVRRVKETGGRERKLKWVGRNGAPDRFTWWPGGRLAFVECKALGEPLKGPQTKEIELMRRDGLRVFVVDSELGVDAFIEVMTA